MNGLVNIDFTHGLIIVTMGATMSFSIASGQWSLALGQLNVAGQFTIVVDLLGRMIDQSMFNPRFKRLMLTRETLRPRVNLIYRGLPKSIQGMQMRPMTTKTFCRLSWLSNMYSLQPLNGGVFLNNIMLMNIISTEGAQPGVSGWNEVLALYWNHLKNLNERKRVIH